METKPNYTRQPTPLDQLTDEEKVSKLKQLAHEIAVLSDHANKTQEEITRKYKQQEQILATFPEHQQRALADFLIRDNDF